MLSGSPIAMLRKGAYMVPVLGVYAIKSEVHGRVWVDIINITVEVEEMNCLVVLADH
jgi:hypothetical protein